MAQNCEISHFRTKRIKLTLVLEAKNAKIIEKSPFFKNKMVITQSGCYQTQYITIILGTWALFFVYIVFDKNPRQQVKNANLCQKPGQKIRVFSKKGS
jgi:hypothetical protein